MRRAVRCPRCGQFIGRRRAGRPKGPPLCRNAVTRYVRQLVRREYHNNIRWAAETLGFPYATLRDLYIGQRSNPSLKTLVRLGWCPAPDA